MPFRHGSASSSPGDDPGFDLPGLSQLGQFLGLLLGQGAWLSIVALIVITTSSVGLLQFMYHQERIETELAFTSRSSREARARGTLLREVTPAPRSFYWRGSTIFIRDAWIEEAPVRAPNGLIGWEYGLCFVLDYPRKNTIFRNLQTGETAVKSTLREPVESLEWIDEGSGPPTVYVVGCGKEGVVITLRVQSTLHTPGAEPTVTFR